MPKLAAKDDPNVKLPAAARRASQNADRLHAEAYKPQDPNPDPATAAPAPAAGEQTTEVTSKVTGQPENDPPANPPAAPAAANPKTASAAGEDDDFKHKYQSLKGRFDQQAKALREAGDTISTLRVQLAEAATAPPTRMPAEQSFKKLLTPDQEKEFGEEFLDVVGKKAQEVVVPELSVIRRELSELANRVSNTGQRITQEARRQLESTLTEHVPDWRQINVDPNFLDWLALPDTYSGDIRLSLLKSAYEANDASRVVAFFKGFLAEEAALVPAPALPDNPPADPSAQPKVPLNSLAAPGRAKTAASNPPAEKPVFTRAQIAQFYADVTANKYRGREKEKDSLEREIFAAQRDGRIR
ncbi:MAG TPA: hypothetical protein VKT73_15150 [Xanthobacteraceae bacterium]|nr:hypothetical protein [Xanthobacteraceae bacterium]